VTDFQRRALPLAKALGSDEEKAIRAYLAHMGRSAGALRP